MRAGDVTQFLTALAVERKVAASTQALGALARGLGDGLEPGLFIALLLGGLLVGLGGGFAWPAYSIRCRVCRLKLFWHAVAAKPHQESIMWVLVVDTCPRCGAT